MNSTPPAPASSWEPVVTRQAPTYCFRTRYTKMRGRVFRISPCSINEGPETCVLAVLGLQFSRPWGAPGARRSSPVRTLPSSSLFRQNPLTPISTIRTPLFLAPSGRAACGIFKRTLRTRPPLMSGGSRQVLPAHLPELNILATRRALPRCAGAGDVPLARPMVAEAFSLSGSDSRRFLALVPALLSNS